MEKPNDKILELGMIEEIKELSDNDFVELKELLELLLIQESERRFGRYKKPAPRESNNY